MPSTQYWCPACALSLVLVPYPCYSVLLLVLVPQWSPVPGAAALCQHPVPLSSARCPAQCQLPERVPGAVPSTDARAECRGWMLMPSARCWYPVRGASARCAVSVLVLVRVPGAGAGARCALLGPGAAAGARVQCAVPGAGAGAGARCRCR